MIYPRMLRKIRMIRRHIRHYRKTLLGRSDNSWEFFKFERSINAHTWEIRDEAVLWAEKCVRNAKLSESSDHYRQSEDPIVAQGYSLQKKIKKEFKDRYRTLTNLRVLVHLPPPLESPGGYSLFSNLVQSLEYVGIPVETLAWDQNIEESLRGFKPTFFMTSDYDFYLSRINWNAIDQYRKRNILKVGLTASLQEYGNTPLQGRLSWARSHKIDFYYSFRAKEYLQNRKEYKPFFEEGYEIFSIEFGANPLHYYPIPNVKRDLNFVFLASSNPEKRQRYVDFLKPLFQKYPGFIDGPWWTMLGKFAFNQNKDRYLYARAKIGINLHIPNQIDWPSELNERTYMLAACGTPQLIDNPALLHARFSDDCFFMAKNPKEYLELFEYALGSNIESQRRALKAQREVFTKHTTFHRVDKLICEMRNSIGKL